MSDIIAILERLEIGQQTLMREQQTLVREQQTLVREQQNLAREQQNLAREQQNLAREQQGLRVDLMERMDRIQDSLGSIREDLSVNMASVEHATRVNENTRSEQRFLQDVISGMQRQIRRLDSEVRAINGKP